MSYVFYNRTSYETRVTNGLNNSYLALIDGTPIIPPRPLYMPLGDIPLGDMPLGDPATAGCEALCERFDGTIELYNTFKRAGNIP